MRTLNYTPYKMIFKRLRPFLYVAILILAVNCKKIAPDFTYSPEMPKAGETVTFTNNTAEGENWNWTFGDGGTSTAKNPTKVYRKPGVYDVTLRVDSNDHFIKTKQITIYDTIPAIYTEAEDIYYYEPFTVSVLAYNPYSYTMTYEWHFSDNAVSEDINDNIATTSSVTLFYSDFGQTETVSLTVTIGDSIYHISRDFHVSDVKARSMLMNTSDGKILRQRMYANGLEEAKATAYNGQSVNSIWAENNQLYLFGSNNIKVIDMETNAAQTVVSTVLPDQPFLNGFISGNDIFWTDTYDHMYKTNKNNLDQAMTSTEDFAVLSATASNITLGETNGGCAYYDNVYFWAKQGTGKGIYRFKNTTTPIDTVLPQFAIQAFVIDEVQQKIYFSVPASETNKGLWVCSIDGGRPFQITDNCTTGLVIDYQSDKIYWTTENSVMYCTLSKNTQNTVSLSSIGIFSENIQALDLALDRVPK